MTPSGTLTTLYSFCSQSNCTDGQGPTGLVRATNGDFYGTTTFGGVIGASCPQTSSGCGTVFEITPSGSLTTLYNFCSQSNCSDGDLPFAGLVQATNGDLYGTTYFGGTNETGCGTIFKVTPSGTLTTLYRFCGTDSTDSGMLPEALLIQATDGDIYGTTSGGGAVG
jgi:uncharacterized repeat protein (TIGR03803 family)